MPWDEIHLLALEPGDSTRRRPARGWPRAVVGDGVEVKGYTGGQWTLAATRRGLLRIAPDGAGRRQRAGGHLGLHALRRPAGRAGRDRGQGQGHAAGDPRADRSHAVETVGRAARGLVTVDGLPPRQSAPSPARASTPSSAPASRRRCSRRSTGSAAACLPIRYAGGFAARRRRRAAGAAAARAPSVLIVAGASALDPLDPVFGGLTLLGAAHGAPRRARPSRQPAVAGALGRAARARHADLRDVLAGDDLRPGAARASWPASAWATASWPSSATAACSPARWPIASRPTAPTPPAESSSERRRRRAAGLYSDVIRERWRRPRFRGELPGANAVAEDVNPLCGDRVRMMLRVRRRPDRRRALRRRLVRDLHGVGRRGRRAGRGPAARARPRELTTRGRAGGAAGRHSAHAHALRDAAAAVLQQALAGAA